MKTNKYRSKFEADVAKDLGEMNSPVHYEVVQLKYVVPQQLHKYTPDFRIGQNTYIESKGILSTKDRQKHLYIKEQHPEIKIYFLFMSDGRLYKGSETRYSDWCNKHGFEYAFKKIPQKWLDCKDLLTNN
jgi:hypothetical protein